MTMPNTATENSYSIRSVKVGFAAQRAGSAVCVVGLGSPHGDDQVGWLVADELGERIATLDISHVISHRACSPVQIFDWLNGIEQLIIIDACRGLAAPGQISRFRWPATQIDRLRGGGSHDFSLWQTLELAARLQLLPTLIDVWCIEGRQFESGQPLSEVVSQAVSVVADQICQAIVAT